jgi:aldose 1-epimerase
VAVVREYVASYGIPLEPQTFPDVPNHPNFASARVDPGRPYRDAMVCRLSRRVVQ